MSYRRRQAVIAALTANALRPVPGYYAGIPAMFGGWLTSELAPHVLALSAADTLREITRGGRDRHALAIAGLSAVGLTALMLQSEGAKKHVDAALCEALGDDYLEHLQRTYTDLDLSTPLRQLAMPFRMGSDEVEVIKDVAYHGDHGRRGLLDIYRPRDSRREDAPVMLQIHGGGWVGGSKESNALRFLPYLEMGWAVVNVQYRLGRVALAPAAVARCGSCAARLRAVATARTRGAAANHRAQRQLDCDSLSGGQAPDDARAVAGVVWLARHAASRPRSTTLAIASSRPQRPDAADHR